MEYQNKKTKRYELRLSENQKERLQKAAKEKSMTVAQYICYLIDREEKAKELAPQEKAKEGEEIYLYRNEDLTKVLWHLAHWGNNLNQCANALNRIAQKRIFSDAKNIEILEKVNRKIYEISKAAKVFEKVALQLKEERHIVVDG